ncbi:unknown [Clostridium sp. CAG:273]|nr:unknown [Clostridium sp. CAG:273]
MKLTAKKNGKGYETSYVITFGSKEARDLRLLDENNKVKEIQSAEIIDDGILIKFKENSIE